MLNPIWRIKSSGLRETWILLAQLNRQRPRIRATPNYLKNILSRDVAQEWDGLLKHARRVPGFEDFLQAKKAAKLTPAAKSGAVVVVNVHSSRCDALAILPNDSTITHIPLPVFSHQKASILHNQLVGSLRAAGVQERADRKPVWDPEKGKDLFEEVLATLWSDLVKPVLEALGYLVSICDDIFVARLTTILVSECFFRNPHPEMSCRTLHGVPRDRLRFFRYMPPAITARRIHRPRLLIMSFRHIRQL
jgi:hypothetical protein